MEYIQYGAIWVEGFSAGQSHIFLTKADKILKTFSGLSGLRESHALFSRHACISKT
jgi:hypothetical protein